MKNFLLVLFVLGSLVVKAQDLNKRVSFSFNETSLYDAIINIENQTDYQFYFIETWLQEYKVTGIYENLSFPELLDEVFNNTLLNYYITQDGKVILTKYNRIYDELPNTFFEPKIVTNTITLAPKEESEDPIFYNKNTTQAVNEIQTVRIGKERENVKQRVFILQGILANAKNGYPAANVAITIEGKRSGTVSKEDGSFSIKLAKGQNLVKFQSLEFQDISKRVIIYNNGTLNVDLVEALEGLDEVLLRGNVNKAVKDAPAGVTKIDVEKSKNVPLVLGERDIFKVAASLPGIATAGEGANGFNVRGGKTDQNLILLDDGVIYNPAHFFGIFSAINPFSTEEVTIYKGHVPAEYGGRLSSVFDILTKDASVDKIKGEASIGLVTSNAIVEVPIVKEKSGLLIGGRTTYSDLILRNLDNEELKKSSASFYDVIAKYNHKINDKNELKVTAYYSKDKFSITSDSLFGYSNRMASIKWKHKFSDENTAAVLLTNSQYKFDIEFDGQTNRNFELGYTLNETALKLLFNKKYNTKHLFKYGLEVKRYDISPGFIRPLGATSQVESRTIADEQALEGALFLSDTFKVTKDLQIEAGLRYSFFSAVGEASQNIYEDGVPKSDDSFIETRTYGSGESIETYGNPEFRIAGRYLFTPSFSVKGGVNTSAQYIHRLSSNTTASPIDTWKLSDANIKPQRAVQYSLGLFKNLNENMYEVSLEGYYKKSKDILDYKVGAQLLLNEALEQEVLQGDGKAYGIEFLLKKSYGKFNGWIGYTYARSLLKLDSDFAEERVNNGEYFSSNYDRPHDFSFVGNFKLTERFSFSSNFVYQTGRPVTVATGSFIINDVEAVTFSDRNEFRIPDYYRLDVGFNVEGNHKKNKLAHSFWTISVYNVLGRNNPYSVFFVNEGGEIKAKQTSIFTVPVPSISYNLKF